MLLKPGCGRSPSSGLQCRTAIEERTLPSKELILDISCLNCVCPIFVGRLMRVACT
jgi:hypothetical protein